MLAALSTVTALALPAGAADAAAGRRIAESHCSRCHVVGDFNRLGGIGSTPSFRLLATAFADWRERFETFYARRPHPAFLAVEGIGRPREDLPPNAHPVQLPREAVADILAYAEELRAAEPRKSR